MRVIGGVAAIAAMSRSIMVGKFWVFLIFNK